MTRKEFQQLAHMRLDEAQTLFDAKLYAGAYHFAGVAVECGIKACISKQTHRFEFPDKKRANEAFEHDLIKLVRTAGLEGELRRACADAEFNASWAIASKWEIHSRYTVSVRKVDAAELLESVASPTKGVMPWLQLRW